MLLQIDGDLNKYYIQTLCMLFYPGAKFAEDDDDKTQSAHFIRVDRDNGVEVSCTFRAEDKSGQATHFEPVGGASMHLGCGSNSDPTTKASKLAAGIAALEAGKQLFGTIPAWGILTGIRPAKLASELLMAHSDDGARLYTPSDIRSMLQKSFLVNPRKAALAVDIAKNEQKIARLARNGKSPTCSVYFFPITIV